LLAPCKFGFRSLQFAKRLLPFGFEAAGDETVVWIDSAIMALSALRLVARPLHRETPLRPRAVVIGLDPLGGGECSFDAKRRERSKHGLRHRIVDLHGSDVEAIDAASIRDRLPGAVIARRSHATGVMGTQFASTLSADRETLQ
jgi:hypothetical protein